MKKVLISALVICLVLSLGTTAIAAEFSDVAHDSWYCENVTRMADMKAISGYDDGSFRPEGSITNGEFLTVLMKTLTGTESYPAESGHWASSVLNAALEAGVCAVSDLDEADLDTFITRAEAAKYTANAVNKLLEEEKADTWGMEELILDWAEVEASGCADGVLDMYAQGIITGDDLGNFNPNANIKRCEAATIVLRAYDPALRQPPFGLALSVESVHSDHGVFFLDCVGGKYDVESLTVTGLTANGAKLDMECLNSKLTYDKMLSASSKIKKAYEGVPMPDAVVKFDWNAADIKKLSTRSENGEEVIDFVFTLDLKLTDGSTLPFTYLASYCIVSYGGIL